MVAHRQGPDEDLEVGQLKIRFHFVDSFVYEEISARFVIPASMESVK
jgi:hypothetical protein